MKKLVIFALLFVVMLSSAVTFKWDNNTESDLAGYRLRWGTNSRNYTVVNDCGLINEIFINDTNFPTGITFYVSVTAYNLSGLESDYSNEISFYITNNSVIKTPSSIKKFRISP